MLTGQELGFAIAAALFAAVGLGALLHWAWSRLAHRGRGEATRFAEMARRLDEVESAREAAELALDEAEKQYAGALGETKGDLQATREALEQARERIRELEAELNWYRGGG